MKIGALIRDYIPIIFEHCEKQDHSEFDRLRDRAYSKETLDVNFPFCKPVSEISGLGTPALLVADLRRAWHIRPCYQPMVRPSDQQEPTQPGPISGTPRHRSDRGSP